MSSVAQLAHADIAEIAAYSAAQAARYAGVPESTVLRWLTQRLVTPPEPLTLCHKNLIECYVLRSLRLQHEVSMAKIKMAIGTLRQKWQSRFPLAEYELSTDERCIFFVNGSRIYDLSESGQQAFKSMVMPYLARIERDPLSRTPLSFHPILRGNGGAAYSPQYVTIDPRVCFGRPVLTGTRITTEVLAGRHFAGERISELAMEYGRSKEEIAEAIEFETRQRAA